MLVPSSLLGSLLLFGWTAKAAGVDDQIAILLKEHSPLLTYPTDFTRDIVPKAIHSHNDCSSPIASALVCTHHLICSLSPDWRQVPLLTALSYGVASVEADVWLV